MDNCALGLNTLAIFVYHSLTTTKKTIHLYLQNLPIMKHKFFFLILMFSVKFSYCQKDLKSAEKRFQEGHFFEALEDYKKAYASAKAEDQKLIISLKTAECYRHMGDYKQAEEWYTKVIEGNYSDEMAIIYLAESKKLQGKYDEAIIEYNNYKKKVSDSPLADDGIKSCELAQKWIKKPLDFKIENMTSINTADPDFSPAYADKKYTKIYFTSSRIGVMGKSINPVTGKNYSDIFETQMDKAGKWGKAVALPEPTNSKEIEEGSAVTKKVDMLFFSRSVDAENSQLWVSTKVGILWGEPVKINFCEETSKYSSPSISADGTTLFFSSNLPGGQGDNDIWMSKYEKATKKWSAPVNLGADINTVGNDDYPCINDDGTLYFSSTGHLGMGGLDICKAEKKGEDQWGNVTNMKYPINSAADDFGITFEGNKEKGFLSSNREGTKGGLDIWSFVYAPLLLSIEGIVTDCNSKTLIEGVSIKLVGSDGSTVKTKTGAAGDYKFAENGLTERYVNPNTSYIISIVNDPTLITAQSPRGFLNNESSVKETTVGVNESKKFKHDFCLSPKP